MKTFIFHILAITAIVLAFSACSKKSANTPTPPVPATVCDTDTVSAPADTTPPVAVPVTHGAAKPSAGSTFNGVSSKNSNGDDEILGFDDDVDDDNDMDAFMNDYHDTGE